MLRARKWTRVASLALTSATAVAAAATLTHPQTVTRDPDGPVKAASRAVNEAASPAVTAAASAEISPAVPPARVPAVPELAERTANEPQPEREAAADVLAGQASWYGPGFAGQTTAGGETYDPDAMTAAHRTLPLGTRVRVTNEHNGSTVTVRINDRGPYSEGRILDVSSAAADALGMKSSGVVPVTVEVLG